MKGFERNNPYLSLCGLNCKLCPMQLSGNCGGCGFGNLGCPIARCSRDRGGYEYCTQCPKYPCEKYAHVDEYDSFITHRNQKSNLEKLQEIGEEKYILEQQEKRQILDRLLDEYNDGRKKTLYCLAVNLMDLQTLKEIMVEADRELRELPLKERSSVVAQLLKDKSDVELKLRKKLDKYYGI